MKFILFVILPPKPTVMFVDFSGVSLGIPNSLALGDTLFTNPTTSIPPPSAKEY